MVRVGSLFGSKIPVEGSTVGILHREQGFTTFMAIGGLDSNIIESQVSSAYGEQAFATILGRKFFIVTGLAILLFRLIKLWCEARRKAKQSLKAAWPSGAYSGSDGLTQSSEMKKSVVRKASRLDSSYQCSEPAIRASRNEFDCPSRNSLNHAPPPGCKDAVHIAPHIEHSIMFSFDNLGA